MHSILPQIICESSPLKIKTDESRTAVLVIQNKKETFNSNLSRLFKVTGLGFIKLMAFGPELEH